MLTQKFLDLTASFGADWVNFVLVGVSVVGLAVFIDRVLFFARTAERYPALIRRIAEAGFEIGSHSHSHVRLDTGDRTACLLDITRSKRVLEDLAGVPVVGFRAPTWTASLADDWLWDRLIELGFRYDSSLFPFRTHMYGSNDNPVTPFWLRPELLEIPPSVFTLGPLRVPYGGGFYFRLYPLWLTRRLIDSDRSGGKTPVIYLHPWEFDPAETPIETGVLNVSAAALEGVPPPLLLTTHR